MFLSTLKLVVFTTHCSVYTCCVCVLSTILQCLRNSQSISKFHAKLVVDNAARKVQCAKEQEGGASEPCNQRYLTTTLLSMPAQKAKLTDLGSMNGCFVNDTRIQGNSVPLNTGDLIKFGYDTATYR